MIALIPFLAVALLAAQPPAPDVTAVVRDRDAAFWQAYNACATTAFRDFFTGDVEFYHDRGGVTSGLDALDAALKKNLCGADTRIRRAAVDGTVRISILRDGDRVYGAIVAGEHLFYVTPKGQPELLDGKGRFVDLWQLSNGAWKMSRVLSYDHGPAQ
jgi:hypothetical protein